MRAPDPGAALRELLARGRVRRSRHASGEDLRRHQRRRMRCWRSRRAPTRSGSTSTRAARATSRSTRRRRSRRRCRRRCAGSASSSTRRATRSRAIADARRARRAAVPRRRERRSCCRGWARQAIKAVRVRDAQSLAHARASTRLISCSPTPMSRAGRRHRAARSARAGWPGSPRERLILAGGLTPDNVADAVRAVRPSASTSLAASSARRASRTRRK